MKITKGKKSGSKTQNKKSLARYRTHWVKDSKGYNEALIVEKPTAIPSAPDAKLKESTKALKMGFPTSYEDVPEPIESVQPPRKRAEVVDIRGKPVLHGVTTPSKDELAEQIARLSEHIEATKVSEEGTFVGPYNPQLSAANDTAKSEVIGVTTTATVHELVPKYGSIYKNTGAGMTPSGLPISEFLEGGKYPPKKTVLHGVTSRDYTYEELQELYDMQQVEIMELKTHYEQRINNFKELLGEYEKDTYFSEDQRRVAEFTSASKGYETEDDLRYKLDRAAAYIKELQHDLAIEQAKHDTVSNDVAIIELQEENSYLELDNQEKSTIIEDLRSEMDTLMYVIDQSNRHNAGENRSKATLTTLANQFNIYMAQHKDDPVKNFFRSRPYCMSQLGALRKHFDDECDHRVAMSNERAVFRKWSSRTQAPLGKAIRARNEIIRIRNEIKGIKTIALNAAIMRPPEEGKWYCKKLADVTQCNTDYGASKVYGNQFRPLASGIDHDAYCKVWKELTHIIPRAEFEVIRKQELRDELYEEVSKTPLFKVVKPLVVAKRSISKLMNYELSSKKRNEAKRTAELELKHATEQASSIKRMREEQFENEVGEVNKDVIRRRQLGLPDHV